MSIDYSQLDAGVLYRIDERGVARKVSDPQGHAMTGYALQGVATEFGKCFELDDGIFYLNPGAFDSVSETELFMDHKGKSIGSTEVYAGDEAVVFRFTFPESMNADLADFADDFDSYNAVSIGFGYTKSQTMQIAGQQVRVISDATLHDVSILTDEPALKSTYARLVSLESCGTLADDYERIRMIGKYVGLHRKVEASQNGGTVKYHRVTPPYDRAADRFLNVLRRLQ